MSSSGKPHAVFVPFSAQGHVNPFMQLVKLLHWKGFTITMVDTHSYHTRLVRSLGPDFAKGLPCFRMETIPDGLAQSDLDENPDVSDLCDALRKNCWEPFKELVKGMESLGEGEGFGAMRCIIADGVMSFANEVARELGIPEVQFWTASACGFMAYLHFDDLIHRRIIPFKDTESITESVLEMPIDWIPGMTNMRLKDMPSFIRTTDINETMFDFLRTETQNCLKSSAVIINTFHDFESQVLEALKAKLPGINIYTIGPLPLLLRHVPENHLTSVRPNLRKEDTECLNWLQKWEPGSVLYVNYGSWTVMSENRLKEFAWGLANSKVPFLWIIRSDVVMGESAILAKEFCNEIKERGYITSWCPQEKVLSHPSVGLFLTHCGWNSMSEALCGGVPLICWPFFAEQQTNCRYACTHWNIAMKVEEDVKREEVAGLVKEMMEGDKGRESKEQVEEWRKKALEATVIGGSSFNHFNSFIKASLLR